MNHFYKQQKPFMHVRHGSTTTFQACCENEPFENQFSIFVDDLQFFQAPENVNTAESTCNMDKFCRWWDLLVIFCFSTQRYCHHICMIVQAVFNN